MKNFFKMEGKFFNILSKIADLLWLNVLTIVCCIPVITAGASITAMYSVTIPMVKNEEGYLTRDFFKAFARNFFQATAMWAVILAGALVILADVHIIGNYAPQFQMWLLIPMCFIVIVLLALFLYAFPLQAYFKNTVRGTLGNALKLAIAHLPYTVVFLILQAMPWIVIYYVTNIGFLVALGWGFAGIGYLCSFAYRGIFRKYEAGEEKDISDEQPE
ncbi:MAG: YesL family protein [Clostridium sp.]|nr:YesL family protein [Clostridium sp.]